MTVLDDFNITTALANYDETRAALVAEADSIHKRSTNGASEADMERFNRCEQLVRTLDAQHAIEVRSREMDQTMDTFAGGALRKLNTDENGHAATETRAAREVGGIPPVEFTNDQLRDLHDGVMHNRAMTAQAIETRATPVIAPGPSTITQQILPPITRLREPMRVASLMPTQQISAASATYYTTVGTTSAATVAEGAPKPESGPLWTPVTTPVRKIAHYVDVSREALEDYANFEQVVRQEMVAGLIDAENLQLLNGAGTGTDGTGVDLVGLLATEHILTHAPDTDEARYISIRRAVTTLDNAFVDADSVVLNPADAELLDLTNSASAGLHAVVDVAADGTRTAWGLRIAITTQITAGTALVADLAGGTIVFWREPAQMFIDPYSQSANNLVRFIVEERLGLGVTRPTALCAVTFNGDA